MNIKELRTEAAKIANQAHELLTSNETLNSDQSAQFDKMLADSDALNSRADQMEAIETRQKSFEDIATEVPESRSEARSKETADRAELFEGYIRGDISPRELRAQGIGTDTAGGHLAPEAWSNSIVETMKYYGPMMDPSRVDMLVTPNGNEINFPTNNDTANKGSIVAENTDVGEENLVFGNTKLGAFKYKSGMILVSNELLADSNYDVQAYVTKKIGERLGRVANEHLTVGTGSSQPSGIVTGSSLGKTAAATSAIADGELIDLFYSLDQSYRANGVFMANDATKAAVRKLKDTNGQYYWQPAIAAGEPETILGRPFLTNNDMADIGTGEKPLVFGDMKCFTARVVQGLGIKRLDERYADFDQTAFIGFARLDGAVLDAAGIKHILMS